MKKSLLLKAQENNLSQFIVFFLKILNSSHSNGQTSKKFSTNFVLSELFDTGQPLLLFLFRA